MSKKKDLKNYLTTGRVLVLIQVPSLRSADKHTPYKMNEANRKTKYSTKKLPRDKKTNALASEVGFRAEPLAKYPFF